LIVKLNDKAVAEIETILKRGNKAVVQRQRDGFIILEEKREIKYKDTMPNGARERAI
jgi:hypothetical protein